MRELPLVDVARKSLRPTPMHERCVTRSMGRRGSNRMLRMLSAEPSSTSTPTSGGCAANTKTYRAMKRVETGRLVGVGWCALFGVLCFSVGAQRKPGQNLPRHEITKTSAPHAGQMGSALGHKSGLGSRTNLHKGCSRARRLPNGASWRDGRVPTRSVEGSSPSSSIRMRGENSQTTKTCQETK